MFKQNVARRCIAVAVGILSSSVTVGCAAPTEEEPSAAATGALSGPDDCTVTSGPLNVRKAPGGDKTGRQLAGGTQVHLLSRSSGWGEIAENEWVSLDYLRCGEAAPSAPTGRGLTAKACFGDAQGLVNAATGTVSFSKHAGEANTITGTWILMNAAGNELARGSCGVLGSDTSTSDVWGSASCGAHFDGSYAGKIRFEFTATNVYTLTASHPCP